MKAIEFLIWLRDELKCMPRSTEGPAIDLPGNGELRRWLDKGVVLCNGKHLERQSEVEFPVEQLIFFPKNPQKRCTIR